MSEDNVYAWPVATGVPVEAPKPIMRPCDYGLQTAIWQAEAQVGTIEAYNRLCAAAAKLRADIDAGKIKPQNPLFAKSIRG